MNRRQYRTILNRFIEEFQDDDLDAVDDLDELEDNINMFIQASDVHPRYHGQLYIDMMRHFEPIVQEMLGLGEARPPSPEMDEGFMKESLMSDTEDEKSDYSSEEGFKMGGLIRPSIVNIQRRNFIL